jgi:hypothetical protein
MDSFRALCLNAEQQPIIISLSQMIEFEQSGLLYFPGFAYQKHPE